MPQSFTLAEYLAQPRPDNIFIVNELLPVGGTLLLFGDPKVGKSFAALQMCQAISRGEDWLTFPTRAATCLYVQLDTPRGLWVRRIEELLESGETLDSPNLHIADRESLGTWPLNILNPDHFAILQREVAQINPDVVIIDTLKESHQLPENDNTDSQRVISQLVAATQPAALVLIHHARKNQWDQGNDAVGGARGASYLTGRMDAICYVTPKTMKYISRASEGGTLHLDRKDNGYWELPEEADQITRWVNEVMSIPNISLRERARLLSELSGMTIEAARSRLRRHH